VTALSFDLSKPARLRFAPSPNGKLHLGHAYSALLNQQIAHSRHGLMLLRIEDIDTLRCTPDLVRACVNDLGWLGLSWPEPVRRQSEHFDDYQDAANRLRTMGLLYACTCSRTDIVQIVSARENQTGQLWPRDPNGVVLYPGTCRARDGHSYKGPVAWRLDIAAALALVPGSLSYTAFIAKPDGQIGPCEQVVADPAIWGDLVLVRKETPTSYHLSVVVDDALQGVSHVVRGRDLLRATDLHVLLQRLLGLPGPLYHHHGLVTDDSGDKLAKSRGSRALADLRDDGWTQERVRAHLGFA
jgi:glutamyl-Q tRNA(Asp) synthetase